MRVAVLLAALTLTPLARADLGVNLYGFSWHLDRDKARAAGLDNWFNPGLGVRYRLPAEKVDFFFDAGFYRDSGRHTALLAGGAAHWRATERARLGVALVLWKSGSYNEGRPFVAPLPVAAWEFDRFVVNMMWSPKIRQLNDVSTLGFWLTYWLR
jgi:hypothetical protein